jgi:putative transcriptional regulator
MGFWSYPGQLPVLVWYAGGKTPAGDLYVDDLKALRRRKFLTQKELAAQVGVSYQTIQTWEAGTAQPRLRFVPKLAEVLNVEPEQLAEILAQEGKAAA